MDAEALEALRTPEGVSALDAAAGLAGGDPLAAASALRSRGVPGALAAAALTLTDLRRRAVGKFGPDATRMFFTRAGYEQATRAEVATRRAARLVGAGVTHIADLGCGIGADSIAFARAGIRVTAIEADPVTAAVAAANVAILGLADRVTVAVARAESVDLSGVDAAFCDPARRRGGGRVFDPKAYSPPWDFVTHLAATVPHTVLKLAPGIDHVLIPAGAEAEWVSVDGDVVEAAFWCGPLASVPRRATLISHTGGAAPAGADPGEAEVARANVTGVGRTGDAVDVTGRTGDAVELTGSGRVEAPVGPVGSFVYDPDGAVIRSHLVAEFATSVDGRLGDPTIAYVYADRSSSTRFGRCYQIDEVMPFSLKRLRATLRERAVGRLTIKKRGSALEPEQLRRDLRLAGDAEATIVLTRVAGSPTVLLCQPVTG